MTPTGLPDAPRAITPYSSPQGTWRPDPHRSARRPLASQLRTRSQRTRLRDDHQTAVSCARLEPHRRESGAANPSPGSPFAAAFSMPFYSSVMKFDPQGHPGPPLWYSQSYCYRGERRHLGVACSGGVLTSTSSINPETRFCRSCMMSAREHDVLRDVFCSRSSGIFLGAFCQRQEVDGHGPSAR